MRADIVSNSRIPCHAFLRDSRSADMSRSGFIGLVAAWTVGLATVLAIPIYIRVTV